MKEMGKSLFRCPQRRLSNIAIKCPLISNNYIIPHQLKQKKKKKLKSSLG